MKHGFAPLLILLIFSCSQKSESRGEEAQSTISLDQLDDYSYAGYDFGESELPINAKGSVFSVEDFGAIADDSISDFAAIQLAIDQAVEAGGGIVLFSNGRYLVNETKGNKKGLFITGSNVVLRGSNETVLFMKEPLVPENPEQFWTTPAIVDFHSTAEPIKLDAVLKTDIIKDSQKLDLITNPNLSAGDIIRFTSVGTFLNEQFLEGKATRDIWTNINENGARIQEYHQVKRVDGNIIYLRAPLTFSLKADQPFKIHKIDMIRNCGFENIRLEANFTEPFIHHKDAIHDSGFYGVEMKETFNSWVANSTFVNVSIGADFKSSLTGTIYRCKIEGNSAHSSFGIETGTRCLIAYCEDNASQWHGPNSSHASVGTVIFRFKGVNSGIDVHGDSPRITLFDQCTIAGFDGESVGKTSHGAHYSNLPNHLNGLVLWNYTQTDLPREAFDFWDLYEDKPEDRYGPLTAVNPKLIGFKGPTDFKKESVGSLASFGKPVSPESLYLAQLSERGVNIPKYLIEAE
ncbi:MAG: DUF4955 domain-containing protein [Cyclobacteriaceae bacterium]